MLVSEGRTSALVVFSSSPLPSSSFDKLTKSSIMSSDSLKRSDIEKYDVGKSEQYDPDAEFGGPEARKKLERKLLWKIDARMSILVVIYILNYVSKRVLIAFCRY